MKLLLTLAGLAGLAILLLLAYALTIGGFSLSEDPELEEARAWVQDLKHENPDLARRIGPECKAEIGQSPWTRDGALALFICIRRKAEATGA